MNDLKNGYGFVCLLILQPTLLLVLYVLQAFDVSNHHYQIFLAVCFIQAAIWSVQSKQRFLFQLFLATTFAFNLALPLLELLGLYQFPSNNLILLGDGITRALSQESLFFAYRASTAALLGATAGWIVGGARLTRRYASSANPSDSSCGRDFRKYVEPLFWICFCLATSNALFLAYFALEYGYVSVMHARETSASIPLISMIGDLFYKLSAIAFLWASTSADEFKRRGTLVLVPLFLQAIAGARGEFVIAILTMLVIYNYSYHSIKLRRFIIIGVALFLIAAFWGTFRFSRDFSDFQTITGVAQVVLFHFLGNSASIGVIAYTYQLQNEFTNNVPFLFGYIDGIFSFAKNYTLEGINVKSYLAQHLTYHLNSDKLFRGSTIGTSYVAEIIEIANYNLSVIFVISGLFLYFARLLTLHFQQSFFLYVVYFHYVEVMLLAPRGSFMKLFSKETFLYACILLVLYFVGGKSPLFSGVSEMKKKHILITSTDVMFWLFLKPHAEHLMNNGYRVTIACIVAESFAAEDYVSKIRAELSAASVVQIQGSRSPLASQMFCISRSQKINDKQ